MEDRRMRTGVRAHRTWLLAVTAVATTLFAPGPISAQVGGPPGRRQMGRMQLEQRIRARFGQIVKQRLGLSDEQAQDLGRVVQSFQGDRRRLTAEEATVRQRVATLLQQDRPSDDEARSLLDRMAELRQEEARLSRQEEDSLLTVLSPAQLLRFDVLREEMGARIRQLRPGQGRLGHGPFGGGGGVLPGGTMRDPRGSF